MGSIQDLLGTTESEFSLGNGKLIWTPTAPRTIVFPDRSGTIALQGQVLQPVRSGLSLTIAVTQIAPTVQSQTANTLRAFPWNLKKAVTISQLRQEVTNLIAGATFRLALYDDDGSAYPGAIVPNTDIATYDAAVTGVKSNNPASAIVLSPGWYWLVVNNSGTPALRAVPAGAIKNILGVQTNGGTNSQFTCWTIARAYGPMPETFPAGATLLANVAAPYTMFVTS